MKGRTIHWRRVVRESRDQRWCVRLKLAETRMRREYWRINGWR